MKRLAFIALTMFSAPTLAEEASATYQNLLTPLLQSGVDVLGDPIVYPSGPANVTAAIVTVPPGGQTGLHNHEVPLFAYILEGELTVDYGEKGKKTYRVGEAVLEAQDWPHNGTNTGTVPMKLLAVYMGGGDEKNTIALAQ
jgi:quercetin dioxygenase-like cupin family protein